MAKAGQSVSSFLSDLVSLGNAPPSKTNPKSFRKIDLQDFFHDVIRLGGETLERVRRDDAKEKKGLWGFFHSGQPTYDQRKFAANLFKPAEAAFRKATQIEMIRLWEFYYFTLDPVFEPGNEDGFFSVITDYQDDVLPASVESSFQEIVSSIRNLQYHVRNQDEYSVDSIGSHFCAGRRGESATEFYDHLTLAHMEKAYNVLDLCPRVIALICQHLEIPLASSITELRNLPREFRAWIERHLNEELHQDEGLVLGVPRKVEGLSEANTLRSVQPFSLDETQRFRHTYIIGKTGSGKSTLLKNLIAQDLARDVGVIILSPENGLLEDLLPYIPPARAKDLIYIDPSDTSEPIIGFNPFALEPGADHNQKAQETYTILERALGDLGVKMTTLVQNAAYALVQRKGSTLVDFERLLDPQDPVLRHEIITSPDIDARTRKFWSGYDGSTYYKSTFEPIINRLDPFLRPPLVNTITKNSFSFHEQLNKNPRIFFFNLSRLRGLQAQVIGQLLIAQIQQTLLLRDEIPEAKRIPYFLYIDEFQTYADLSEGSMIDLFNRARKYRMAVTLAHQVTADIPSKLLSVITGNVGTMIAMQVSAEDAGFFTKELQFRNSDGQLMPTFLQSLHTGQAVVRTPSQKQGVFISVPLNWVPLPEPMKSRPTVPLSLDRLPNLNQQGPAYAQAVKELSKLNFGTRSEQAAPETPPPFSPEPIPVEPLSAEPNGLASAPLSAQAPPAPAPNVREDDEF